MPVDDGFTKALLHMDGADASTTFTDESGKTWTAYADAQIDTAQSKFGGASGLFDGTGDYISTPDHNDFDFGAGDFTVDCWVRHSALAGYQHYISQYPGAWALYKDITTNRPVIYLSTDGGDKTATSSVDVAIDTWYHIAAVRYGNTVTIYIDGTARGTVDVTGCTVNNSANLITIAAYSAPADFFSGWIDEVRISKGIARWTANFTPPTAPYSGFIPRVMIF